MRRSKPVFTVCDRYRGRLRSCVALPELTPEDTVSALTSAPRSSVVHVIDGRPGVSLHQTMCGRRIGDEWAGEYNEAPAGPATCQTCIKREAAAQAELEAAAKFQTGQRVGILTGVQSVGGAFVGSYGTVTAVRAYWNGKASFHVQADGE